MLLLEFAPGAGNDSSGGVFVVSLQFPDLSTWHGCFPVHRPAPLCRGGVVPFIPAGRQAGETGHGFFRRQDVFGKAQIQQPVTEGLFHVGIAAEHAVDALETERLALNGFQLLGNVGIADVVILEEGAQPGHAVTVAPGGGG